ncbi:hypothetical protein [Brevundimonas sp. Leaf363]|uniref:hypothetical protein n=1 Tax=Brevundimonas sp. Leaf363 TaxID=1736353 RepID=UPI000A986C9F|nr:hypothetical protein [Brevundimonas sp. Leaf363]
MTFAAALHSPVRFRASPWKLLRRIAMTAAGIGVVLLGVVIAPLPGPLGLPVMVLGLMLILKASIWAKRAFIRAQRARPNWVYPFRRLLRRKPEFAPVFWQQLLRIERLMLRRGRGSMTRMRKKLRRGFRKMFH